MTTQIAPSLITQGYIDITGTTPYKLPTNQQLTQVSLTADTRLQRPPLCNRF